MWLVDVYNYDKEIKLIFIFWFDIVMQFLYKNQKKIAKISARNRNVDWLQVKIAEIKKDKKKLERKK